MTAHTASHTHAHSAGGRGEEHGKNRRATELKPAPAVIGRPPAGMSAQHLLTLQRSVGNASVAQFLRSTLASGPFETQHPPAFENEPSQTPSASVSLPANITVQRNGPSRTVLPSQQELRQIGDRFSQRNTDLGGFLRTAVEDMRGYRARFRFISGSYELSYGHFRTVIGQMNAQAETEQQIINLAFSYASNIAIGAMGNALQAAGRISEAMNLWGGSAVNTGSGLLTPQIDPATIGQDLHPALRTAQGLQRLDDLSQVILPIAARGVDLLLEPARQSERLTGEVRVAAARGGTREMSDEQVRQAYRDLQEKDQRAGQLAAAVQSARESFDALRQAQHQAPWIEAQRAERDIWILWISQQDVAKYGMYFFAPLGRSVLHRHLIDIGLATEHIGATPADAHDPATSGGELGAATEGFYGVVNGQYVSRDGPQMIKDGAVARAPEVGRRWSSAMLSGSAT